MQTYYSTLFFFYTCIYLTVHKTLDLFAVTLLSVYHSHNSASQSTVTNSQMHPYIETLRYTHSYYLSHIYSYPLLVNTQPTQSDTCSVQVHHCEWRDSLYSIRSSPSPHTLNTVHIFTTLMIISASPSIHTSIHTISLSLSIYMMWVIPPPPPWLAIQLSGECMQSASSHCALHTILIAECHPSISPTPSHSSPLLSSSSFSLFLSHA